MAKKTTLRSANEEAKGVGMRIRKVNDEYQVKRATLKWDDASVYYTNSIDDAVETMRKMATPFTPRQLEKVKSGILTVWQAIGDEIEQAVQDEDEEENLTNYVAIETCIDGNRLRTYGELEADKLVTEACRIHGYHAVMAQLLREVSLA